MTKTNAELELDLTDELAWDPKVDSEEIAVSADGGTVTLRGTVGSFRQKREAGKAAQRVYGVLYVNNDLDVRILDEYRHDDADLRGDVLQALMLDALVPSTIDASVKDGNVAGVTGIENDVYLTSPTPYAGDVKDSIKKAMKRDAKLDAENIDVETVNGTAVLTGTVRSWAEHDSAVQAAWAAPGVTNVDDRLAIIY